MSDAEAEDSLYGKIWLVLVPLTKVSSVPSTTFTNPLFALANANSSSGHSTSLPVRPVPPGMPSASANLAFRARTAHSELHFSPTFSRPCLTSAPLAPAAVDPAEAPQLLRCCKCPQGQETVTIA